MYKYYSSIILILLFSACAEKKAIVSQTNKSLLNQEFKTETPTGSIDSVALLKNKPLYSFYKLNGFCSVWNTPEKRKTAAEAIANAEKEGLNPEDYQLSKILANEKRIDSLSEKEITDYDLLLTASLEKYISDLSFGKLNPKKLYDDWDLKVVKSDSHKNLSDALQKDSLSTIIEKAKPNHAVYKRLENALVLINQFPEDTLKTIEFLRNLKPNDTSKTFISIKRRLAYWNDLKNLQTFTNLYDAETQNAVKRFQLRHGLEPDGIIGKGTLAQLNVSKDIRKKQIIANMERWRWFPKEMGEHYIIVNIPEYKLRTVFKSDTTRTHNVIVGTAARKTPILTSKLSYAVFNPTWTVPPTILKEDIIPSMMKNRNYLKGKNITIYDQKGKEVNPWSWNSANAKKYRYVQSPGTYNSLGMVKIIFPNNFSVYLHDTNHKEYFEKTDRSLSSGCVRVQDPLELTEYLLDDKKNWNVEKITETLKTEKTKNATFKSDIFIHQLYWTAWSDKGLLYFTPDIYDLDASLYVKLRQ